MKSLEKMSFTYNTRNIISFLFYIVFGVFTIIQIIHTPTYSSKIFYLILLILILGVALYSEYLKYIYRKAIKVIAFDLDAKKGEEIFETLLKKDIFHSYKNDKKIFDTLYYIDQMKFEECLEYIEKHSKFFHSSIDQLLIYHYTKFYCSYNLGNYNIAKEEYSKLERMKNQKTKGAKVSPIYNWEFIDSVYLSSKKDYKQSLNTFKTVNTQNMNNREKVHYYYQCAVVCLKLKDRVQATKYIEYIKKLDGKSQICKEGEAL